MHMLSQKPSGKTQLKEGIAKGFWMPAYSSFSIKATATLEVSSANCQNCSTYAEYRGMGVAVTKEDQQSIQWSSKENLSIWST